MRRNVSLAVWAALAVTALAAWAPRTYPLDGWEITGIRRLRAYQMIMNGEMPGRVRLKPGAMLPSSAIELRLRGRNESFDISSETPRDPQLQSGIEAILRDRDPSYRVAIVDITDPENPRHAAVRPDQGYVPGSVGKLLVMTGLFHELKRRFPNSYGARAEMLRSTRIVANGWAMPNSHAIPVIVGDWEGVNHRSVVTGDDFSLWEWVDHMVSPSSNAAGTMVWRELMLMRAFDRDYPVPPARADSFFTRTPAAELGRLAALVIDEPLAELGIDTARLNIRTFFTAGAWRIVPRGGSRATPDQLVRWMIKLEQGRVVDEWSSLEMKKLMYFTRARYRYASSPALDSAAVYFKSGSVFRCQQEPDFQCRQYHGNRENLMHSVAIVESPAGSPNRVYVISMMSNVLRINSAAEHQELATRIDRLVRSLNSTQ